MDQSRAQKAVEAFRAMGLEAALRVAKAAWKKLPMLERASLTADWTFWARPKQLPPPGNWRTWGFLTGRGFGKTLAIASFINWEILVGRAKLICLLAQDEQSAIDIQVNGPSGLIATAPPWNRPIFEASSMRLVWPNGATAHVRTPEVPGKIRGLEYDLTWASELQSWPNATREEALDNCFLSTRLGYSRICWDSTPKKRHPLLKALLAKQAADPAHHHVVRGTTHENADNLGPGYVAEIERKFKGTQRGREEIFGEMLEDSELALVKQAWIDETRRDAPSSFVRRVVSIDPSYTNRKGSDTTGIVEVGLGSDGRVYVLGNATGKYEVDKYVELTLDWYVKHGCDLILTETNKGGQAVTHLLKVIARERKLEVIVVDKDERPQRIPGKVFVKEVYARGAKDERAEPVATAYERRRISHVLGADLGTLEDTLTTWEPAPNADSPGDLDALVHGVVELLGLSNNTPDPMTAFKGITEVGQQLSQPLKSTSLSRVFSVQGGRTDRI